MIAENAKISRKGNRTRIQDRNIKINFIDMKVQNLILKMYKCFFTIILACFGATLFIEKLYGGAVGFCLLSIYIIPVDGIRKYDKKIGKPLRIAILLLTVFAIYYFMKSYIVC